MKPDATHSERQLADALNALRAVPAPSPRNVPQQASKAGVLGGAKAGTAKIPFEKIETTTVVPPAVKLPVAESKAAAGAGGVPPKAQAKVKFHLTAGSKKIAPAPTPPSAIKIGGTSATGVAGAAPSPLLLANTHLGEPPKKVALISREDTKREKEDAAEKKQREEERAERDRQRRDHDMDIARREDEARQERLRRDRLQQGGGPPPQTTYEGPRYGGTNRSSRPRNQENKRGWGGVKSRVRSVGRAVARRDSREDSRRFVRDGVVQPGVVRGADHRPPVSARGTVVDHSRGGLSARDGDARGSARGTDKSTFPTPPLRASDKSSFPPTLAPPVGFGGGQQPDRLISPFDVKEDGMHVLHRPKSDDDVKIDAKTEQMLSDEVKTVLEAKEAEKKAERAKEASQEERRRNYESKNNPATGSPPRDNSVDIHSRADFHDLHHSRGGGGFSHYGAGSFNDRGGYSRGKGAGGMKGRDQKGSDHLGRIRNTGGNDFYRSFNGGSNINSGFSGKAEREDDHRPAPVLKGRRSRDERRSERRDDHNDYRRLDLRSRPRDEEGRPRTSSEERRTARRLSQGQFAQADAQFGPRGAAALSPPKKNASGVVAQEGKSQIQNYLLKKGRSPRGGLVDQQLGAGAAAEPRRAVLFPSCRVHRCPTSPPQSRARAVDEIVRANAIRPEARL